MIVAMLTARHISVSIARPWREVYDFASMPENLALWAAGLDATAQISVTPRNEHGVIDHDVTLPDGAVVHVPLRVIANGTGAEVIFTLFQLPQMTTQDVDRDAAAVAADLVTLKSLLEGPAWRKS
jgi:hypothetical protein